MIELLNIDCMTYMATLEDKAFDLAIVDPEYRNNNQPDQWMRKHGNMGKWKGKSDINYFKELFRVSKNQIIWGGNYYAHFLEENNNWIVWYKNNDGTGFSMAELAWCSIRKNIKVVQIRSAQTLQQEKSDIHPTQKPVKLYKWLLKNYAKPGDKILDTHGGSMSIAIACHQMCFDLTLCEIDKDYYEAGVKRYNEAIKQQTLFSYQ